MIALYYRKHVKLVVAGLWGAVAADAVVARIVRRMPPRPPTALLLVAVGTTCTYLASLLQSDQLAEAVAQAAHDGKGKGIETGLRTSLNLIQGGGVPDRQRAIVADLLDHLPHTS